MPQQCACTRPTNGDTYLCTECANTFRHNLQTITGLTPALDEKRAKYGAIRYSHGRSTPTTSQLPYDPRVTPVAGSIRRHLLEIRAHIYRHHAPTVHVLEDAPIPALAAWVSSHVGWLATQPDAPAMHATVDRDAARLVSLLDRPPDRLYLGTCGVDRSDGTTCPEPLYVTASQAADTPDSAYARCVCGAVHDVAPRRADLLQSLADYQATLNEIVHLRPLLGTEGTSRASLSRYVTHGLLHPVGVRLERNLRGEYRKVSAYRIGDVYTAVDAWRNKPRKRRDKGNPAHVE